MDSAAIAQQIMLGLFVLGQLLYASSFLLEAYFSFLPVHWVSNDGLEDVPEEDYPFIVLFYPVLKELESTMRTTFKTLDQIDYPKDRFQIISIPNTHDTETIASLRRLQSEFSFLEIMAVPPTTDPSWQIVWDNWDNSEHAYWWHKGPFAGNRDLPPKKTRQLIYAFYHIAEKYAHEPKLAINYIDADSCPPRDHFKYAVKGLEHFDVLQAQNVAGNLNQTMASTLHAFDHMAWDGHKYPHLSAPKQPFWVLGKGLFFKAKDLVELGGFHPWIAIEDPEVGLRMWRNGRRLGVISSPLIEEVPTTFMEGINQRKRWVCGFLQTLTSPLSDMRFPAWAKFKAWLVFMPCLSLLINVIGIPTGIWALWMYLSGSEILPTWTLYLALFNVIAFTIVMIRLYSSTWKRTGLVFDSWRDRVWYMIRINPVVAMIWWLFWTVHLIVGLRLYLGDGGKVWERTKKIDANNTLMKKKIGSPTIDTVSAE